MKRYENKNVVITGAAQGIGQATAKRIAEEGGSVALIDIKGLEKTHKMVEDLGGKAFSFECDVTVGVKVKETVDAAAEALGGFDTLFHIAGILRTYHTHEMTFEQYHSIMNINMHGTFYVNQAALPHLLKNKYSSITNMASTAAIGSHPWMSAYAASKGAVVSFTRALYIEYVKQGLRANSVVGGGIATSLHSDFKAPPGGDLKLLAGAMPFVGFAKPEKIASVFAFLGSDDARFINGTEIRADGGALS